MSKAYAEFIRTFTFESGVGLPIVQPGSSLPFSTNTVPSQGVEYFQDEKDPKKVGFIVGKGRYFILFEFNTAAGSEISLLVNGRNPRTEGDRYPYARVVSDGVPTNKSVLIEAPKKINLITLTNTGKTLVGLESIPNTRIGNTSEITHIIIRQL